MVQAFTGQNSSLNRRLHFISSVSSSMLIFVDAVAVQVATYLPFLIFVPLFLHRVVRKAPAVCYGHCVLSNTE
jgi:hypothetical protein